MLGIIDFEVLACYMPWDLTCSLLACLLVGFSLNAPTKPSNELWECSLLIKSIKQIVQRENRSPYNSHMDSPVSIGTQSVSSISSDSVIFHTNAPIVSHECTLRRGSLLEIARPAWTKVTESEQRLAWMKLMIARNLIVRDLDAYSRKIGEQLRSDEYQFREEENT